MEPNQLIADLQATMTLAKIGEALDVDRVTVWRWAHGHREPRWRDMDALRALHAAQTAKARPDATGAP